MGKRLLIATLLFFLHSNLIVFANPDILKLAPALTHTCALYKDGTAQCWGSNGYGILGLGDMKIGRYSPKEKFSVGQGKKILDIQTQDYATCVLINNGSLKCWGWNNFGQLGTGMWGTVGGYPEQTPEKISAINLGTNRKVKNFFMGRYSFCAILDDNSLKCWGGNKYGQLGQGDRRNRGWQVEEMGDNLFPVSLGTGVVPVSGCAGDYHTCVILEGGIVKCWGYYLGTGNGGKFVGLYPGDMGDNLKPIRLGEGVKATKLSCGEYYTCALTTDSRVKCWGANFYGNLGLGLDDFVALGAGTLSDMGDALPFVNVGLATLIKDLSCALHHCCVRLENNAMKCWGGNVRGELGLGDNQFRGLRLQDMGDNLSFTNLGRLAQVTNIYIGGEHSCARLHTGAFKCWGSNLYGQLGLGGTVDNIGVEPHHMGDNLKPIPFGLNQIFH